MKLDFSALSKLLRQNDFAWRFLYNWRPTLDYKFDSDYLSLKEKQIVDELNADGFAKTAVFNLFDDLTCYQNLLEAVQELEEARAKDIDEARERAAISDLGENKSFKLSLLGPKPIFDLKSVYAQFATQATVLKIANAYLGMFAKIKYYNIWHNFPTGFEPKSSQLWHRDRDDNYILKMFVYLSDVDEEAGPFWYALGTHKKGKQRASPEYFIEKGVARSTDEQMNRVLPKKFLRQATGAKGTIIFADTRGYHKGGWARKGDRLLFTCMFTSPGAPVCNLMTLSDQSADDLPRLKWVFPT